MDESRPLPMFKCELIEGGKLAKEWQEWKGSLECYFDSFQITDEKMRRAKMLHLGGPQLQKVFRGLEGTENFPVVLLEKPWYSKAVERLDAFFKPRRQDVLERHKLRNMKQGINERFSQFILRLRQQITDCGLEKYPQEVRAAIEEMMITDVIVEGCSSQELRRRILEKDQSLADIEALGASLESVRSQEREISAGASRQEHGQLEVRKIHKFDSNQSRNKERIIGRFHDKGVFRGGNQTICYSCGQQGHISKALSCPAKGKSCRRCMRPGHFEKVCRKRPGENYASNADGKVRAIETALEEGSESVENKAEQSSEIPDKKVYYTFHLGNNCNVIDCTIGGVDIQMFVDSGSDANLITTDSWEMLKSKEVVVHNCQKGSCKILKAYGSQNPLEIRGTFMASITAGGRTVHAEFFVVANGQRNLLGDTVAKQLGVLRVGMDIHRIAHENHQNLVPFPKIKDVQIHIQMDPEVVPVFQPLRRIPMPLEDAVNKKLDELLERDIIEKKIGPATWVSPLVVANKANGEIRLCVDLRRVNQAVIRERHPMPVIEDVLAKIGRGSVWSTLDVKDAFFLLELDEASRDIVTFISHRGLYRFKRLPFGLVSAPEVFQRTIDEILADCSGAYWYLDDVGVEGRTMDEHDTRLNKILQRFEERGIVLNWNKCKFRVTEFEFLGYRISHRGIQPSSAKLEAISKFRRPINDSEVRSFLGLANYMGKFIPNLATLDEPLRNLTQKGVKFQWGEREENAFEEIKTRLSSAGNLGFYKPEDETSVVADASPYALGAVLIQTNTLGESRVICFASKSLTDTERRYCQTEKEALALVWSVERFQTYLIGREFKLLTDCKALTFLFSHTSRPCARIERWVLRLQGFRYTVMFIPGKDNLADVFSRLSTEVSRPFDAAEELTINEIVIATVAAAALKWEDIEEASRLDPEIQQIVESLESGNVDELPLSVRMIHSELCQVNNVLLRIDRIIVPKCLQQRVLEIAHEGHPGVRIMKGHLRSCVWWPKIDKHVEDFVRNCRGCSLVAAPNPPEPMIRKELPLGPWEQIAIDFLGPLPDGENLLVCVDYYSRYVEVVEMTDISTKATIDELLIIFSRYGIPLSLRADNGPQFSSDEFKMFCDEHGIKLVSTIPYWPQMNGEVERQNRSILKRLKIAQELGKDWRKELRQYLLMYHAANHTTTGKPPSKLMLGRRLRTKLPTVPLVAIEDGEIRDRDKVEKEKGRQYADTKRRATPSAIQVGDRVLAKQTRKKNKLSTDFSPEQFEVVQKKGTDVTLQSSSSGKTFRRSAAHLKVIPHKQARSPELVSSDDKTEPEKIETQLEDVRTDKNGGQTRAKRARTESKLLKDYVTY